MNDCADDIPLPEINFSSSGISYISPFVDMYGNPTLRTPNTHPYSYDSYVLWRNHPNEKATASAYSDRMMQWNADKYTESWKKQGLKGQRWNKNDKVKIEAFVKEYFEKPDLEVCYVMQCCNHASGYPLWFVAYSVPAETPGE